MKTNVIEMSQWERQLEVEVSAERLETEFTRAYRKYQQQLEIPGFRKGKVPLRIIEARYGESIRDEVIADLLPTLVEEAAREAGLVPATPPRISKLAHEPGQQLTFTALLDIWPQVEVENYEGLEATRIIHQVTDEEIDRQLKALQERQAVERAVERPLQVGDVLIADLQRLDDSGLPIIGERYEERRFLIGREDAPSPEFEKALIGIRAGEEREVRFTYRSDLPDERLAGTQDHFRVKARQIYERSLPPLDDEFAKDLGNSFQTLADLRQYVADQLARNWEIASRQRLRRELVDQLIRKNPFDLPPNIVDYFLRSLSSDQNQSSGAEKREPTPEERRLAERQLRQHLLFEGMRRKLDLQVSEEEFEAFLSRRSAELGCQVDDLKRATSLDSLRRELEEEKIFDLLIERAAIKEEVA